MRWVYKWKMQINSDLNKQAQDVILSRKILKPTNTPRVFHVEYTWCICNSLGNSLQ